MRQKEFVGSFFQKHHQDILRFLTARFLDAHDAEDIAQDAFHNILDKEGLETMENPRAYLYKSAKNLALNRIRQKNRQKNHAASIEYHNDNQEDETDSVERRIIAQKDLEKIEKFLVKLPEKHQKTFILSRVHAKTYAEISQELDLSVSTVEKHIIKVLGFLRNKLDREELR